MQIIKPLDITPTRLIASNVPITETQWVAGSYATGTQRYVGTQVYEVVATPSTSDEPTAGAAKDPPTWIGVGAINRFRMFDKVVGYPTIMPEQIDITISPGAGTLVDSLAFFGLMGQSLRIRVLGASDEVVADKTVPLVDLGEIDNWWSYFFLPLSYKRQHVELRLPPVNIGKILVTIDAGSGVAGCGEMVMGAVRRIGETIVGVRTGIRDFSQKTQTEFGGWTITPRRHSSRADFPVFLKNDEVAAATDFLIDIRTTPSVFIGSSRYESTVIYGYYRDFGVVFSNSVTSELTIEVEGLT